MRLHRDSHVDHLPREVIDHILRLWETYEGGFFIGAILLPEGLPAVDCALYGPLMGDPPVGEERVHYASRGARPYPSRLIAASPRPTRTVTVIAGPHDGLPCVLYTAFGGPHTPKEVADPNLTEQELPASVQFWGEHALASA